MCQACTAAARHFTAGTIPASRPLPTSVQQGTSPDWNSATAAGQGGA